jgi:hypothetical protein
LWSLISAAGEQRLQKWKHAEQCRHHENAAIAILNVGRMNDDVEQETYCGLKFPRFPESDFKIFGGFDDDRLNAAVSRVGFGLTVALDARPLLSALRTEVRHRAMSEKCQ